jgi:O-antigen ligase
LAFELVVAVVIRAPVLPVWVTGSDRVDPPLLLFWSRDLLLDGGPIQGVVGSSSLLAMTALCALIVFSIQLATGSVRRLPGAVWVVIAIGMIALTRSATIILGLAAVIVALGVILLLRRARTPLARRATWLGIVLGAAVIAVVGVLARGTILASLGKSEDLTGRLDIWARVIDLAVQRPVFGWGWISFWAPWVEPFRGYIERRGVVQLHAHDAWLDVWLQLGIVGLIVFAALVASTLVRSFSLAVDPEIAPGGAARPFSALTLLAPLLMTALLVQSVAESRILVEGGWMLLTLLTTTTKLGVLGRSPIVSAPAAPTAPGRTRGAPGERDAARSPGAARAAGAARTRGAPSTSRTPDSPQAPRDPGNPRSPRTPRTPSPGAAPRTPPAPRTATP